MDVLTWIFVVVVALFLLSYVYAVVVRGVCKSNANLFGKTAIITGANTGIGLTTALDLARRNCRVIMACRSIERGERALSRVVSETGNTSVKLKQLDLSSMESVRNFAAEIIQEEPRLDILINNAGVAGIPRKITSEGLERTMAVNHLGPFLLTNLLLGLIKRTGRGRIVVLSSIASMFAKVDLDDFFWEKRSHEYYSYNDTKLANILFTKELSRRLEGTGVTVNCLHPGSIRTELLRSIPLAFKIFFKILGIIYFKSPEQGAQTTVYCAVSEELEGVSGKFFMDCKNCEHAMYVNKLAYDEELARKLWEHSEKLTGLKD